MKAKKECLFFLLLIVIFWTVSQLFNPARWGQEGKVNDRNKSFADIQAEKKNTIDVLVLGDSESYTSISPMLLWEEKGISSYICGQTGQRMPEAYYMLKTAEKTQNPKVVILETNMLFRSQRFIKDTRTCLSETVRYYFPMFRYHNLWKLPLKEEEAKEDVYKGFFVRDRVRSYKGGEYMKETDGKEEISSHARLCLDAIQKLCEEKGMSLILVSAPSPKNYNYERHNALSALAKEKDIPYLDLNLENETLDINWKTDSVDRGDHLNLSGAHKVTEYVGNYLGEHYELADHRGEAKYRDWDTMAKSYGKKAEKKIKKIRKEKT